MPVTLPATSSFSEFADLHGYKRSYITELKKQGRLVLTDDGKRIHVEQSIARLRDTADPSKIGVARRHAATRASNAVDEGQGGGAALAPPEADEDEREGKVDAPYQSSRAERERWLALAAKRDYEQSIGKLMDAADVESAVATAGVTLRKALERLPDILAPQVAPITDEAKIRALLAESVEIALSEVAQQFAAIAKGGAV